MASASGRENSTTIVLSNDDIDAIARTAFSEVGHFRGKGYSDWENALRSVVDTILNRIQASGHGETTPVVDAKNQFSAISGGRDAVGTWRKLPPTPDLVKSVVFRHIAALVVGTSGGVVGGDLSFLNPFKSDTGPLAGWGQEVADYPTAEFGGRQNRDYHAHGTESGRVPVSPNFVRLAADVDISKWIHDPDQADRLALRLLDEPTGPKWAPTKALEEQRRRDRGLTP